MKKIFVLLILALTLISLSAVSASENVTDVVDIADDEIVSEDVSLDESSPLLGDGPKVDTTISANATTGYEKFSTQFTVTLTQNNTPLASKPVSININGVTYDKKTNTNGQASVYVKLAKGSYTATFTYVGDNTTNPSSRSAKITIKSPYNTVLKQVDKDINYRQGLKSLFQVRLLTTSGSAVKNQEVKFIAGGKTYTAKTDARGYASIYLSLKKGTRTVKYSFKSSNPYLSSSGSTKLKVKAPIAKGYGYWMWASGIKSTNLKTLKKLGTKHIFLHSYAIDLYGKSTVKSWIAKANKYGMKVHIWMQVFYNGNWVRPVNDDGSLKYSYMSKKISLAKSYAKISGVAGIHFDYLRFGGTAYKYATSNKAINYFTKKASIEVRKVSPNCIVSAAVMPEPGMMDYYYGQDVSEMSKYLDVIVPMAYKGNYGKNTEWIKYVTSAFNLESNGAQIWTGLQAYKSDDNVVKLSTSQLLKDAKASIAGGAKGVVLFRIGVTHYLNFNKV